MAKLCFFNDDRIPQLKRNPRRSRKSTLIPACIVCRQQMPPSSHAFYHTHPTSPPGRQSVCTAIWAHVTNRLYRSSPPEHQTVNSLKNDEHTFKTFFSLNSYLASPSVQVQLHSRQTESSQAGVTRCWAHTGVADERQQAGKGPG